MNIQQQNWFKYIIGDGYDLNDGLDEPVYEADAMAGYRGIRCASLDRFIMLLTIAIQHAASEETDHYDLDLPTCGGFDFIVSAIDGSVFFFDDRYPSQVGDPDVKHFGTVMADAVYDS